MGNFVQNSSQFSADCVKDNGLCLITPAHFLFLGDSREDEAIAELQRECGNIVLIPDATNQERTLLYHMSCERITDVVQQIFQDALEAPVTVSHLDAEMTLGELCRRPVVLPYEECRQKVDAYSF